jgi:LacI family transcriptional regulator
MAVTIKDIAKIAGVSTSTVSRCLNNNTRISLATRERVKKIADDLGFVPNNSAKSLSTKKTGLVGIVYQESLDFDGSRSYIDALFINLRHELERLQMDTIQVEAINTHTHESNAIRLIKENKIDGFLFLHTQVTPDDLQALKKYNIPAVQVHFPPRFTDMKCLDYFISDNFYGGVIAGEHLIKKHCKKTLLVRCSPNIGREYDDRTNGFIKALEDNHMKQDMNLVFEIKCDVATAYNFVLEHIELIKTCDSIFAQADVLAVGMIQALKEEGIRVPEDIKVVGFDDSYYSRLLPPFITTIHQPKEQITEKATKRIKDLISGADNDLLIQEEIKPYLIERESSK